MRQKILSVSFLHKKNHALMKIINLNIPYQINKLYRLVLYNGFTRITNMDSRNYSNARAQLSRLMDQAIDGFPVEITRKGRESVVMISKSSYDRYKKKEFEERCKGINGEITFTSI